jgi:hypothetical protein
MPRSITCPRCSTALGVPVSSTKESMTCPRCLAELQQPGQHGITPTPANTPELEGVCPECGEPVGRNWRYCPNCEESLWDRGSRGRRRSMELDVRRDNTAFRVVMILLAALGGVGIVLLLLEGLTEAVQPTVTGAPGTPAFLLFVLAGLFVVGCISALTVLFSKEEMGAGRAIGLAAFRSLVIVGLITLLAVAALIFVCVGCVAVYGNKL